MKVSRVVVAALAVASLGALAAGCGGQAKAATAVPSRLNGLFKLSAGHCTTSKARATGSYLVVISAAQGRAVRNPRGGCANPDYTPLRPGTDGGLSTGAFQSQPSPLFDARRDSKAARIIRPAAFGRYRFGFATYPRDEQDAPTSAPVFPAPRATVTGSTLNVDLRSLVVSYGGRPDSTCRDSFGSGCWNLGSINASGTYDAKTRQFVIDWFTGESFTPKGDSLDVHLVGTFVPAAG